MYLDLRSPTKILLTTTATTRWNGRSKKEKLRDETYNNNKRISPIDDLSALPAAIWRRSSDTFR